MVVINIYQAPKSDSCRYRYWFSTYNVMSNVPILLKNKSVNHQWCLIYCHTYMITHKETKKLYDYFFILGATVLEYAAVRTWNRGFFHNFWLILGDCWWAAPDCNRFWLLILTSSKSPLIYIDQDGHTMTFSFLDWWCKLHLSQTNPRTLPNSKIYCSSWNFATAEFKPNCIDLFVRNLIFIEFNSILWGSIVEKGNQ